MGSHPPVNIAKPIHQRSKLAYTHCAWELHWSKEPELWRLRIHSGRRHLVLWLQLAWSTPHGICGTHWLCFKALRGAHKVVISSVSFLILAWAKAPLAGFECTPHSLCHYQLVIFHLINRHHRERFINVASVVWIELSQWHRACYRLSRKRVEAPELFAASGCTVCDRLSCDLMGEGMSAALIDILWRLQCGIPS